MGIRAGRGSTRLPSLILLSLVAAATGCGDDPVAPGPEPPPVPALTAPDSVIRAIEVLYEDQVRTPEEKAAEFAKLLLPRTAASPGLVFRFTDWDVIRNGAPDAWGFADEMLAHDALFAAIREGQVHSLRLDMTLAPARDLDPPEPGREGWKEITATDVDLVLLFTPDDGLAVSNGEARFLLAPHGDGTWRLADWEDSYGYEKVAVDPWSWGRMKLLFHPEPGTVIPPPESPLALIEAIHVVYNSRLHTAAERVAGYRELLAPGAPDFPDFVFHFLPGTGLPESWGFADELAAHEGLFTVQENGGVYSLALIVQCEPPRDPDPPIPGGEGWQEVFASNTYLRLMFNPNNGLEVNGAQGRFLMMPASGGRWYIAEWWDLPRPAPAVETTSWGFIKASFR